MNIGIFTDTFYPEINGVATSVSILEKQLVKMGHKVYIFTVYHPDKPLPNPRVFRLPSIPFIFLKDRRMCIFYSPKAIKIAREIKLDIIHTQTEFSLGFFGKGIAKAFHIPTVHTYHTMYVDYVHYIAKGHLVTPKMAQDFSRMFCNSAEEVVTPAQKSKDSLLTYGVTKPIHVIPTGIDLEPFDKKNYKKEEIMALKESLGLHPTNPTVLFLGRIAKEKSLDVILEQMPSLIKKMPSVQIAIVGDGPLRQEMEILSQKLNIQNNVCFLGNKPWDEIGKYYQLGDVFVSASTSETQGLTFTEAMAAGVPVVAKKDESIENLIINNVSGQVYEQNSQLPDLIFEILTNREKAHFLTQNAYQKIQSFSAEKFASAIYQVYERVYQKHHEKASLMAVMKGNHMIQKIKKLPSSHPVFHKIRIHKK